MYIEYVLYTHADVYRYICIHVYILHEHINSGLLGRLPGAWLALSEARFSKPTVPSTQVAVSISWGPFEGLGLM